MRDLLAPRDTSTSLHRCIFRAGFATWSSVLGRYGAIVCRAPTVDNLFSILCKQQQSPDPNPRLTFSCEPFFAGEECTPVPRCLNREQGCRHVSVSMLVRGCPHTCWPQIGMGRSSGLCVGIDGVDAVWFCSAGHQYFVRFRLGMPQTALIPPPPRMRTLPPPPLSAAKHELFDFPPWDLFSSENLPGVLYLSPGVFFSEEKTKTGLLSFHTAWGIRRLLLLKVHLLNRLSQANDWWHRKG